MAQPSVPFEVEAPRSGSVRVRAAALGAGALIIIPTYNELGNLRALVSAVLRAAPAAHLLIVDDASPDGTGKLADSLASEDERVRVLHREGKLGLGTAYIEGFRWGLSRDYQSFLEMDADFSHDPGELPRLLGGLQKGAELVLGSRGVRGGAIVGWGIGRRLLSAGGSAYSRFVLGVRVRDLTTGYKAFSRRALEELDLGSICSNGYSFQIELTYRVLQAGLAVTEVPITFVDRRAGQSKMDSSIFLEAVGVVWRLRAEALRRRT